jgi:glycosyltransferase involved in cell wall biosynthesis
VKILSICASYPPCLTGGAELVAHRHNRLLAEQGIECQVFTARNPAYDAADTGTVAEATYEGITVRRVSLGDPSSFFGVDADGGKIIEGVFEEVIDRYNPDIIHIHSLGGFSVSLLEIAASRSIKIMATVHDHWGFCHRQTLTRTNWTICSDFNACNGCHPGLHGRDGVHISMSQRNKTVRDAFQKIDAIVSPSHYLATKYEESGIIERRKIHVIGNGVEKRFFDVEEIELKRDEIRFGFLGALSEHKGVGILMDVLSNLSGNESWSFHFSGFGSMGKNIDRFQHFHPNGKKVFFKGSTDLQCIDKFFSEIDVLVVPSIWPENQPLVIMEAMASGRPVIASRIGGIPELVEHKINGILINHGDDSSLLEAMIFYLNSRDLIRRHGQAARSKACGWYINKSVDAIKDLYSIL